MTTLTLVGHAITPDLRGLVLGGLAEPDPAGLEAARGLSVVADRVYVGPEPASLRTAEALGFAPEVESALRDREYGTWSGRTLEELLAAEPEAAASWLERPHTAPPGGETANDVISRVADWLADVATSDGDLAAVVHPVVVRAAVLAVLEAPAEMLRRIDVRPLALVRLGAFRGTWSVTLA